MSLLTYHRMSGEGFNGYIESWYLFNRIPVKTKVNCSRKNPKTGKREWFVVKKKKNKDQCNHNYSIIGIGSQPHFQFIECDIVCSKCGKTGTIYVFSNMNKKIFKFYDRNHHVRFNRNAFLTVNQMKMLLKKI